MDVETLSLYAEGILGADAHDFFNSELGRYVLARSKEEADLATEELKEINPFESEIVADLQTRIKIAESAVKWLNDMLISGKQAIQILEEGE